MLIWKIAWRNLWRHRGKSLVIGLILFLGAFLMTVGNAIIEGAKEGMSENMVARFTGHLVLKAANEKENDVWNTMSSLKVIPDYPGLKALLQQQDFIESFAPMTRGMAMILNPDGNSDDTYVFGVNFEDYQRTFLENVTPVEGRLLRNGERGLLITEYTREHIFDDNGFWIAPEGMTVEQTALLADQAAQKKLKGVNPEYLADAKKKYDRGELKTVNELIIMGVGSSSFGSDVRVPIKGIFEFKNMHTVWQEATFMDIETFREAFGYISAANNAVELTDQQQAVLNTDAMDDLFQSDVVQETEIQTEGYNLTELQQQTQRADVHIDADQGAYNIVAVKVKPGMTLEEAKTRLQQILDAAGIRVTALTWKQGISAVSQFASITQGALLVFVVFIFFVAIIVIMNTLSMAAIERVAEIGMMRAVGAQKWFVTKMFLSETFILSFIFGGAGILIGIITCIALSAMGIAVSENELVSLMFGGDTFNPIVTPWNMVLGILQLSVVTVLAVVYPMLIARKITPLEAISRD
ncbi:ABC transporter, permease protein [Candidatus Moduliflexus flocculans]|uniref:ABC transporter, permease protein n=1 Tax=Candidatus Moduliflexus flocculans TaxID=1499966 RepID=A0A0S6VSV5_9BACT|nr:ABC transporter, permease protein [Candidatus Moduliflexus flocculans]